MLRNIGLLLLLSLAPALIAAEWQASAPATTPVRAAGDQKAETTTGGAAKSDTPPGPSSRQFHEADRPTDPAVMGTAPKTTPAEAAPDNRRGERSNGVSDDYLIGAGDVLQIHVWKEPDASVAATVVRPEGKITMPLLKEVSVAGLTPRQAEQLIGEQLSKFINNADVTVVVSGINSKKIYVIGAVKKEGPIAFTYRMTILQALSEAGGLTEYAKRKKIYVLRKENGRDFRFPFDYDAVLRGERMELNIPLIAGDTLVIPH